MENRLTLLIGEARSGKTWQLLDEYVGQLREGARCLWIAPNQPAVDGVRDAVARLAGRAVLHPGVVTFSQLAESLVQRSERRLRPLSPVEQQRLLQNAIRASKTAGTIAHFAAVAESPGFRSMLARTIAEWKRRDRWAEDLVAKARTVRQRELAELYHRYQFLLSDGDLYDKEGLFWAARDWVKKSDGEFVNLALAFVDGFTDFTAAQLEILTLLAQRAQQMTLSLLIEPECLSTDEQPAARHSLFARPLAVYQRFRPLAARVDAPRRSDAAWPAAEHVRRHLFRDARAQPRPSSDVSATADRVHIIAASSVQAEFEEVARLVKRDLLEGTPAEDIVVAIRHLGPAADRMRQVCDDFGLPVLVESARTLATAPLMRSLLRLLQLHAEDWPFHTLLAVVGDGCIGALDEPSSDCDPASRASWRSSDRRAALELGVREAQVPAGRRELLDHLAVRGRFGLRDASDALAGNNRDPASNDPHSKSETSECLAGLRVLDDALAALSAPASIPEWTSSLERLIKQLDICETDDAVPHDSHWVRLRDAMQLVAQADAASGRNDELLSAAEIAELIAQTASQIQLPRSSDGVGRVRIVSAETARSLEFERLYIVGLTEQSFSPSSAASDWSHEAESDAAGAASLLEDATALAAAQADEMLLFYQLVARPERSLTLSYAALDDKAQPLPPSPLLIELEQCLAGCETTRTEMSLGDAQATEHSVLSTSERRQTAVAYALAGDVDPLARLTSLGARQDETPVAAKQQARRATNGDALRDGIIEGLAAVASRRRSDEFSAFEGVLSDPSAGERLAQRFGPMHLWSASQLETYAECPYRFFGQHVLRLRPLPTFALEDDFARRGSLLHAALALMHRRLKDLDAEADAFEPQRLEAAFRAAVADVSASQPAGRLSRSLREIERRQIEQWAEPLAQQFRQYAAQWSDWDEPPTPAMFEVRFGPKHRQAESSDQDEASAEEPFELPLATGPILLTGQIDRVDVGRIGGVEAFNVIDYKSSRRTVAYDQMASGAQVQLPLYALVAERQLLAERGAQAFAAGYWDVRDTGFGKPSKKGGQLRAGQVEGGVLQSTEQWETLQSQLLERIEEIVAGVRRGDFPVFNENQECTKWCQLHTICRIGQIRSLRKTWTGRDRDQEEGT